MRRRAINPFICGLGALYLVRALTADTVVLNGQAPFERIRVTDFRAGRVVFIGLSRERLRVSLERVACLTIDTSPHFNAAEQARAAGDPATAVAEYHRAADESAEAWLLNLILVRQVQVHDLRSEFDEATSAYTEVCLRDSHMPARFRPRNVGPPASDVNRRARGHLAAAIESAGPGSSVRRHLRSLLLELTLIDEAELDPSPVGRELATQPATTAPTASRPAVAENDDSGQASRSIGMLRVVGEADSPTTRRGEPPAAAARAASPQVPETTRLPEDSLVLEVARRALTAGDSPYALRLLARARPFVPAAEDERWELLTGRARLEAGDPARAAADLLQLSERTRDGAVAAEAIYCVGLAHEKMNRADVATRLYQELLTRPDLSAELRARVQVRLEQLGE